MKVFIQKNRAGSRRGVTALALKISKLVNLRRDANDPAVWRPSGTPARIAASGALPLFTFTVMGTGRDVTLWADGLQLSMSTSPEGSGVNFAAERTMIGRLPAEPLRFSSPSNAIVRIDMKWHAPAYLLFDSELKAILAATCPRFPALSIHAVNPALLTARAAGRKLSGASAGRRPGALAQADNLQLVDSALTAYGALKLQTEALGRFMQPVLARYRVLGPEGETLICGPWTMPSAADGLQCVGGVSFPSADSLASVTDATLQARSYLLQLSEIPALPEPWATLARRLVVEVSEPIDPVDEQGAVSQGFVDVDVTGGVSSARVYLPGCSATRAANPGLYSPLVINALRHAVASPRVLLGIDRPFDGHTAEVFGSSPGVSAPVSAPAPEFSYSVMCAVPGGCYGLNPKRLMELPASPASYGTTDSESTGTVSPAWCTVVEMSGGADGRPVVEVADSAAASGVLPTQFSPLLTVPYEKAAALTLSVRLSDGTSRSCKFPLTPLTGTGLAYYLAPDLKPVTLPEGDFSAKVAKPTETPDEGVLHWLVPGELPRVARPCDSHIVHLEMVPRAASAWDFARSKVLVFSDSGIWLATFDASGAMRASALLDGRRVASPQCVARCTTAKGAAVVAMAGNYLLRVLPSGTEALLRLSDVGAIGWAPAHNELWLRRKDTLLRYTSQGDVVELLADEIQADGATTLYPHSGTLFIATSDGLFDTAAERMPDVVRCRMRLKGELTAPFVGVEAFLLGSDVVATVKISGDNGTEIPEPLYTCAINGQVNTPLRLKPRIPRRRFIALEADGRFSPDSVIRP